MMRGERKKEIRCVNEQQNNGLKLILFILVREGGGACGTASTAFGTRCGLASLPCHLYRKTAAHDRQQFLEFNPYVQMRKNAETRHHRMETLRNTRRLIEKAN